MVGTAKHWPRAWPVMLAVGEVISVTLRPDRFAGQRKLLGGRVTLSCRGNCLVCLCTLESTPLQFSRNHGGNCLVCEGCRGALALRGPAEHAGAYSSVVALVALAIEQ
jgi:hypothetical protein